MLKIISKFLFYSRRIVVACKCCLVVVVVVVVEAPKSCATRLRTKFALTAFY